MSPDLLKSTCKLLVITNCQGSSPILVQAIWDIVTLVVFSRTGYFAHTLADIFKIPLAIPTVELPTLLGGLNGTTVTKTMTVRETSSRNVFYTHLRNWEQSRQLEDTVYSLDRDPFE